MLRDVVDDALVKMLVESLHQILSYRLFLRGQEGLELLNGVLMLGDCVQVWSNLFCLLLLQVIEAAGTLDEES